MERAKEAPAQLRCRLRKIRLRTHRFSEAWGPTMCLNAEERFELKERLLCWGGVCQKQFREVGMPALLKGALVGSQGASLPGLWEHSEFVVIVMRGAIGGASLSLRC